MAGSQLSNIFSFRRFANLSCQCGPSPGTLGWVTCCRCSSSTWGGAGGKVQCLISGHIREWFAIYRLIVIRAETGEVNYHGYGHRVKKLRGALRKGKTDTDPKTESFNEDSY